MSLMTMNLIVLGWFIGASAVAVGVHRVRSGQWKPYSEEEVNDPDWHDKH